MRRAGSQDREAAGSPGDGGGRFAISKLGGPSILEAVRRAPHDRTRLTDLPYKLSLPGRVARCTAPRSVARLWHGDAATHVDYLLEQAAGAGTVTAKPMFGEYGFYVDGKMVGSLCDDQLYVKPTEPGRSHAEPVSEASPYPGAKPHLLIGAHRWEDSEWLGDLLRLTAAEVPTPKPRKAKRST